jgi:hypothetical protein
VADCPTLSVFIFLIRHLRCASHNLRVKAMLAIFVLLASILETAARASSGPFFLIGNFSAAVNPNTVHAGSYESL